MDRWLTIDEYMDTFLALLAAIGSIGSLIFVGLGYQLAKDYLNQHRQKVKEERRIELIKSAKEKISLFNLTANRLYDIPQSIFNKFDDPAYSVQSLIMAFFSQFYKKKEIDDPKLEELAASVSTNLILLERGDLQDKWFLCHSNTKGLDLFHTSKNELINNSISIDEKKRQFYLIPRSFSNGNHHLNEESRTQMTEIQDELTKMYHS